MTVGVGKEKKCCVHTIVIPTREFTWIHKLTPWFTHSVIVSLVLCDYSDHIVAKEMYLCGPFIDI